MKQHARKAFQALEKIGAPVYDRQEYGAHFILGAELRTNEDVYYADYYQEQLRERVDDATEADDSHPFRLPDGKVVRNAFGIREDVHRILAEHGLYSEWINPGMCGIYDK